MSHVCDFCSKKPDVGNLVSHSNRKTSTRRFPNLQWVKLDISGNNHRFRICTKCMRTMNKVDHKGLKKVAKVAA